MIIGNAAKPNGASPIDQLIGTTPMSSADGAPQRLGHEAQAFVAQLPPNRTLDAHYHGVDQFQVFIRGSGEMPGHSLSPGVVHYADAHRPYGPIVAGPHGLAFLTLRSWGDQGAFTMPDHRALLSAARSERPNRPTRNISFDLSASHGGYLVVVRGAAVIAGDTIRSPDVVFLAPGDTPAVEVGDTGAKLAYLQLPSPG